VSSTIEQYCDVADGEGMKKTEYMGVVERDGHLSLPDAVRKRLRLKPDQTLRVTLVVIEPDEDRAAWANISAQGLSAAYGETEANYTLAMVKETNAEYKP
jgi:hypothetical protein